MLIRRVGLGIGILAVGAAAAVSPIAPGVAGAKPSLCSLNKNVSKVQSKAETAIVKAMEAGNWKAAQKALIASFGTETGAEKAALAALSGAPANVRAAGAQMMKFAGTEIQIIRVSTSATQFEKAEETAAQAPKVVAAEQVLSAYFDAKCGAPKTSTPVT
jgi:hypothetical protein